MAFIEVDSDHYISNKGIMSIRQGFQGEITVRYISGEVETITTMSMAELLQKLGRFPKEMQGGRRR